MDEQPLFECAECGAQNMINTQPVHRLDCPERKVLDAVQE